RHPPYFPTRRSSDLQLREVSVRVTPESSRFSTLALRRGGVSAMFRSQCQGVVRSGVRWIMREHLARTVLGQFPVARLSRLARQRVKPEQGFSLCIRAADFFHCFFGLLKPRIRFRKVLFSQGQLYAQAVNVRLDGDRIQDQLDFPIREGEFLISVVWAAERQQRPAGGRV